MDIRLVKPENWEAIKLIYEEGIQTGNATFQLEAPTKEQWYAVHDPSCSIAAVEHGVVIGWAALINVKGNATGHSLLRYGYSFCNASR